MPSGVDAIGMEIGIDVGIASATLTVAGSGSAVKVMGVVAGVMTSFLHSMSNDNAGVLVGAGASTGNVLGVRGMREGDKDTEGDGEGTG